MIKVVDHVVIKRSRLTSQNYRDRGLLQPRFLACTCPLPRRVTGSQRTHIKTGADRRICACRKDIDKIPPVRSSVSLIQEESSCLFFRSLSNLFNAIPQTSPLRHRVYTVILELATKNDQLDTLQLQRTTVEKWLTEWQISQDEKARFLKVLADAFTTAGQS